MSQCFNPNCLAKNSLEQNFCSSCGSKLLLGDRYRAIKYIGEGGFGRTFKAIDEQRLNTACVIKQFLPSQQGGSAYQKSIELFKQEANCLKELGKHPQIPELLAFLEQDNRLYLVQEFIEGNNLLQELEKKGRFPEKEVEKVLREILEILQFIHQNKVIHRDIKPENILRRNSDNKLVLIDFGIARDISTSSATKGTTIGSFGYVAWEQMNEGKAYYSSDLYSLGVTCFHLLTDKYPWELYQQKGYSWLENWQDYLTVKLNSKLREILTNLLQINYQNRYISAEKVLAILYSPVIPVTTVNQTAKTVQQIPVFKPKIKINDSIIYLQAQKIGQFLTGEIKLNNYTDGGTISGEWQVKQHYHDPPYTKDNNHPWILFKENSFFSHQPETITPIISVNTSQLRAGQIYRRKISLLINPGEVEYTLKLKVKTAPIPLNFPKFPYVLWLSFLFSLILLFYLFLNYQITLNNLLQNIDISQLSNIFSEVQDNILLTKTIIILAVLTINLIDGLQLGIGYWKRKLNQNNQRLNQYFNLIFIHLFVLIMVEIISIVGIFLFLEYQMEEEYFVGFIGYIFNLIGTGILTFLSFNLVGILIGFIIYIYRQIIKAGYPNLGAIAFLLFTTSIAAIISLGLYIGNFSYLWLSLGINTLVLLGFFAYKVFRKYYQIYQYKQRENHLIKS